MNSSPESIRPGRIGALFERRTFYAFALSIFAASRCVVLIGIKLGGSITALSNPDYWEAGTQWYHRLLRWDSGWYAGIVVNGYQLHGGSVDDAAGTSLAFFPLYPVLAFAVKSILGVDQWIALLLVANVASLAAVLLMAKFFRDELGEEVALVSLALFCFFPTSLFLSAGYSESLCLVFILLGLILLGRERFVAASSMAGLALATRPTGIVLLPVILLEMARRSTLPWRSLVPRMVLCGLLAASGLLAYMAYLWIAFGDPLLFAQGQGPWHKGTFLDRLLSALTLRPILDADWTYAQAFLPFLILTVWSFTRLKLPVALFGLGALLLPYLTLGVTMSMNRFALLCLPAFMALGLICRQRAWLASILVGLFAALLLVATALFSKWYWLG